MKIRFIFYFIFISKLIAAQQNYFNVISSEITPKNKLFFQQQININQDIISNTTLTLGVTKRFEVGINLFGIDYFRPSKKIINNAYESVGNLYPLALINAQYKWFEKGLISCTSGFQLGSYLYKLEKTPAKYIYTNARIMSKDERINGVVGIVYGNETYLGNGIKWGLQTGIDVNLKYKNFHFVADAIVSDNDISNAVIGFSYFVNKHCPLSFGWQIPFNIYTKPALVLEFTYLP